MNELINYNIANFFYKDCFFLDYVKNYDNDFFIYKPITINYQLQNVNPDEKIIDNIYSTIEKYNQNLFINNSFIKINEEKEKEKKIGNEKVKIIKDKNIIIYNDHNNENDSEKKEENTNEQNNNNIINEKEKDTNLLNNNIKEPKEIIDEEELKKKEKIELLNELDRTRESRESQHDTIKSLKPITVGVLIIILIVFIALIIIILFLYNKL